MENIKVNFDNAKVFESKIMKYSKQVEEIHKELHEKADDKMSFADGLICQQITIKTNSKT